MAYDGMVTAVIAQELDTRLSRGKIEKIYQPEREEIVLVVRTREGRRSSGRRIIPVYIRRK